MTTSAVLRQIRHMATLATVTGGSAIFDSGSVIILDDKPYEDVLAEIVYPAIFISERGFETPYPNARIIHRLNIDIKVIVDNGFDAYGTAGIIGVTRADATRAVGMGCVDIFDELDRTGGAFRKTGVENGLGIVAFTPSGTGPEELHSSQVGGKQLIGHQATLTVIHANQAGYEPPASFSAADATGGDASLSWTHQGNRFDHGGVMIRSAAGATPPATSTDGTEISGSPFARGTLAATDSPGAGQISYAIWSAYDPDTQVTPGTYPVIGNADTFNADADRITATITVT